MNPKVRSTLTDDFSVDQACSICGQKSLHVVHLDAYPDYVNCDNCGSAFVVEDGGDRVMYGKIPARYPETRHFALQEWVWPEAIARKAAPERKTGPTDHLAAPPPLEPVAPAPTPEPEAIEEPSAPEPAADQIADIEPGIEERLAGVGEDSEPEQDMGWDTEIAEAPTPSLETPSAEAELEASEPPTLAAAEESEDPGTGDWAADFEQAPADSADLEPHVPQRPDEAMLAEQGHDDLGGDSLWASQPPGEPFMGEEPAHAEDQSGLGDEEDLLESLWGEEPYPEPEIKTTNLPEPPAWASEVKSEDGELASPEMEAESRPDDAEFKPIESDQDTADRLHAWGAPQEDLAPDQETSFDDQMGELSFPWETPTDEADDDQTPAVAPFEEGDWDDNAFGLSAEPGEATPEPADDSPSSAAPADVDSDQLPAGEPETDEPGTTEETPDSQSDDGVKEGMAQAYWGGAKGPPPPQEELPDELPAAGEAVHQEPPPGNRYRVVVKGANVRYPDNVCSHCTFSPAPARLPVLASISRTGVGDRQIETLRIPVCEDCKARATARSEEQRTAQLQAHLIGVLVALVLIVCGLGIGFINLRENLGPALVGLVVMAGLGYVVPAVPLLLRASRLPTPPDSNYIRSTLRVPGDTEGTETAFEWRNQEYARRFLRANAKVAVSEVTRVRETEI